MVTASVALGTVSLFARPPGISVPASTSPEINKSNQSIFDFISVHSKVVSDTPLRSQLGVKQI